MAASLDNATSHPSSCQAAHLSSGNAAWKTSRYSGRHPTPLLPAIFIVMYVLSRGRPAARPPAHRRAERGESARDGQTHANCGHTTERFAARARRARRCCAARRVPAIRGYSRQLLSRPGPRQIARDLSLPHARDLPRRAPREWPRALTQACVAVRHLSGARAGGGRLLAEAKIALSAENVFCFHPEKIRNFGRV